MACQHRFTDKTHEALPFTEDAFVLDQSAIIGLFGGSQPVSSLAAVEGLQVPDCTDLLESVVPSELCMRGEFLLTQKSAIGEQIKSVVAQDLMSEFTVSTILAARGDQLPNAIFSAFGQVCQNLIAEVDPAIDLIKQNLVRRLASLSNSEVSRVAETICGQTAHLAPVVVSSEVLGDEFLENGFGLALREDSWPFVYDLEIGGFNGQYSDLDLSFFYVLDLLAFASGIGGFEDSLFSFSFYGTHEIYESLTSEIVQALETADATGDINNEAMALELIESLEALSESFEEFKEYASFGCDDEEFASVFLNKVLGCSRLWSLNRQIGDCLVRSGMDRSAYYDLSQERFKAIRELVSYASDQLPTRDRNPLSERPFSNPEQLRASLLAVLDFLEEQAVFSLAKMEQWSDSNEMEVRLVEEVAFEELDSQYGDAYADQEPIIYRLPQDALAESLYRRAVFRLAFSGVFSLSCLS